MSPDDVRTWFTDYLTAFTALGRGEADPAEAAAHLVTPLLVTTDEVVITLPSRLDVVGWLQAQAGAMSSTGYDHTALLSTTVEVINETTAMLRARMVRRRRDGSDIVELSVTYLVVRDQGGLGAQALMVHST